MQKRLSANKPLYILGFSMTLMLTLVTVLGYTALNQIKLIEQNFNDFYQHPFAVSNAANSLKHNISQNQLNLSNQLQTKSPSRILSYQASIEAVNIDTQRQLKTIQLNFLGNMDRVKQLRVLLEKWQVTEQEIHRLIINNRHEEAKTLFGIKMLLINEQVNVIGNYILGFAMNKAMHFQKQAKQYSQNSMKLLIQAIVIILFVLVTILSYLIWFFYQYNEKIETRALTDKLTGLYNRTFLEVERLNQSGQEDSSACVYTLLVLDIDHFKNVNDTYGHNIGDQVLIALANALKQHFRKDDLIVRWGGEEFVVILPKTTQDIALPIIEKLRILLETLPVETDKGIIHFTVSIGVSEFQLSEPIKQAFERSDSALYQAKNSGRNRIVTYAV